MCQMKFNLIDKNNWNRSEIYEHFTTNTPCTYSMTVNIDITNLYNTLELHNLKFFPTIIYGISCIVNNHREFRMDVDDDGNIGYYDVLNPCYTIFHESTETFTNVWTKYEHEYLAFLDNYSKDMNEFKMLSGLSKPVQSTNLFNVSCIPWSSFTGFNLNLQKGYTYFLPIFTVGKYYKEDGKHLLPLAIQVHHAVCDGFHVAKFVNELQLWADGFTP